MSTRFCKWPPTEQAKAVAYNDECTTQSPDVGSVWGNIREDRNGNWTVPLLGPPWSFNGVSAFPEPASCALLRADAVTVYGAEFVDVDE